MKKTICLFLTLVYIFIGIYGCNSLNKKPITLADNISIPVNGLIESSVFETLKQENKAVIFVGESNGIRYEWVIFGNDIKEAKELNLGIEIIEDSKEKLSFRFLSKEDFGFSPTLSFYLNDLWNAGSASVYEGSISDFNNGEGQRVSITGNKQSILNFSPKTQTGSFIIVPDIESENITAASETSAYIVDNTSSENIQNTQSSQMPEASQNTAPEPQSSYAENPTYSEELKPENSETESSAYVESPNTEKPEPNITNKLSDNQRPVSDGKDTEQDKYKTEPVPEGKPLPVEPEEQKTDTEKSYTCTFSIECSTIFSHLSNLKSEKLDIFPKDGIIFAPQTVTFYEGESVYDVLKRICRENKIHMEASWTPMYNSAYVEGIGNLYEFDCGSSSGWMYQVDGWYPNYGCSRYQLKQGEKVEWRYTCELGRDIGGFNAVGK